MDMHDAPSHRPPLLHPHVHSYGETSTSFIPPTAMVGFSDIKSRPSRNPTTGAYVSHERKINHDATGFKVGISVTLRPLWRT